MNTKELYYAIALQMCSKIGNRTARTLVKHFRSFEKIFIAPKEELETIDGVGLNNIKVIKEFENWDLVESEVKTIEKHQIQWTLITEESFPRRLYLQEELPYMFFYNGAIDFNPDKCISIVGTRAASKYGIDQTRKIVADLARHNATIVSGLAFGIDIAAHKAAIENGLPTWAVVAHGLHTIYPPAHQSTVALAIENGGGIVSSYLYDVPSLPAFFVDRNKIVAAISDAVIVVESAKKGGSMITALMANDFNKDVFAIPGKNIDPKSAGPNHLIKTNQALLLESVKDLEYILRWDAKSRPKVVQRNLFLDLDESQTKIVESLKQGELHIEILAQQCQLSSSQINSNLLQMELQGLVESLPGKIYRLLQ